MPDPPDPFAAYVRLEGVPSALAAARDGVDALLRDRGLRRTTPELTAESLLRGAAATARLEGSTAGLEDLRAGNPDQLGSAALRLNAQLLSLVPVIARSPLQALATMHVLVAVDSVPEDRLGRPRAEPGLAQQLKAIADSLLAQTSAPALAVAAITHGRLLLLAPFDTGNAMVARACERLVLVARGLDPTSMVVPEAGHDDLAADYRAACERLASGGAGGYRDWLLHCANAVTRGVEHSPLR